MTKKLHVCLLTSSRVFEIGYGGEGKFTRSLGNWLLKKGHDVTIMGSSFANISTRHLSGFSTQNIYENISKQKKIKVIYPPYSAYLISRLIFSLLWVLKIIHLNIKYPIHVIHAQDTGYSGLAAVVSGRILRIPVIISSHGIRHKSLESIIQGKLKKFFLLIEHKIDIFTIKNADRLIVVNPAIKEYFEQAQISRKIDYIPVPINVKEFEFSNLNRDQIREEMGIRSRDVKVMGFVGRFSAEKNLFTILQAFESINQNNCPHKLVLVGAGYLESRLKQYADDLGLKDKVIFFGVRHDIGKVLAAFDVFLFPSYTEGFGIALLEAMAGGRAIICSDIPTIRRLVTHGQEALLVDPNNVGEFGLAIKQLCKDDSLRHSLGYNARIKAAQYDEEFILPKIERLYETFTTSE